MSWSNFIFQGGRCENSPAGPRENVCSPPKRTYILYEQQFYIIYSHATFDGGVYYVGDDGSNFPRPDSVCLSVRTPSILFERFVPPLLLFNRHSADEWAKNVNA